MEFSERTRVVGQQDQSEGLCISDRELWIHQRDRRTTMRSAAERRSAIGTTAPGRNGPVGLSETPGSVHAPGPEGQHTELLLTEELDSSVRSRREIGAPDQRALHSLASRPGVS